MTTSDRQVITELASTQLNRSATVNAAIAALETGAGAFAVVAVGTNTPPGSPTAGQAWVVGTSPTGAWAGKAKYVARYYNSSWIFIPPIKGYRAYDQTSDLKYNYDGSAWAVDTSASVMVGDSGSGGTQGLVPAPAAGDAAAAKFLKANGTWAVPAGGGGGSSAWALAGSWTWSTNVAQVDFTGLGSYNELMVIMRGVTASASGFRVIECSTDNGSTFRSTSGDYVSVSNLGVETNQVGIGFTTSATASAVSGIIHMPNIGLSGVPKEIFVTNIANGITNLFVQSTNPVNAIRIASIASAGNLTAGSIYVLGR